MSSLKRMLLLLAVLLAAETGPVRAESDEPTGIPPMPTLTLSKNLVAGEVVLTWTATASPYSVVRDTDLPFPRFGGRSSYAA